MFNVDRFPIRSDSIRLGKTPPTRISQKKDLSNGFGALVLSYLEVERAVHAVLLRPEDARQVFRHDDDDDDDERRIYTEGKIWSLKKVANFVGEKIRVKRDTHTHTLLSKGLARASSKKQQRGVFGGRSKASKNVKRETPFLNDSNETSIASLKRTPLRALKKIDIIIRFQKCRIINLKRFRIELNRFST